MRTPDADAADRARLDSANPPPTVAVRALRRLTCGLVKPPLRSPDIVLFIINPRLVKLAGSAAADLIISGNQFQHDAALETRAYWGLSRWRVPLSISVDRVSICPLSVSSAL